MPRHNKISEAESELIADTYNETKSTQKTAEITGRSLAAVLKHLQKHGFELKKWVKTSDINRICQVYQETQSSLKTAEITGWDSHTVLRILKKKKVPIRRQGQRGIILTREHYLDVRKLALEGYSAKTIQDLLGLSQFAVQKALTRMRISLKAVQQGIKKKLDEEYD